MRQESGKLAVVKPVPLRSRLFLLAAAGIVPVALMSAIALYALFDQQRDQTQASALEIARALGTAVDSELGRTTSVLQSLAGSNSLEAGDVGLFEQRAVRLARTQPAWRGVILADPTGRQLLNTTATRDALPATVERESFERAVRTQQPTIGYLFRGPRGMWAVPVRVPVVRDGVVRYVITAPVDPDSIAEVVARQKLAPGWVVTVTDERVNRVVRWPGQGQYVGTPVTTSLREMLAQGGEHGTGVSTTIERTEVYTAFARSPVTGWAVAVGIPTSELQARALKPVIAYGGGLLLSLVLGVLAALSIARGISRPMAQLRAAAQALGRGERGEPPPSDIREIRDVSEALALSMDQRAQGEAEREVLLKRERTARAAAEDANRAKDEFLAMLGHELRNPLGAIANAASLLQHPGLQERARQEASGVISRQVSHLTRLTDDLLDAGRALMGKIVLRREPVNLAAAAAHAVATLKAAGKLDGHRVVEQLEEAWVEVDPIRLDQIVANLLTNAGKYTPVPGTIRVVTAREGADAVLRVIDNGIGLSPELAARAFDLFVQGDRDLDRAQGGLGIGLTLVRRLAELHGGTADVRSDGTGKGSEFAVRLPAIAAPLSQPAPAAGEAAAPREILVIEDNEDARETLSELLRMNGHRVRTAEDGAAGLEAALAERPDVALVDIGLPTMDGYEVARRIRAAQPKDAPYLIALTGYGLPEDKRRALEAGFDAHLVKPVDNRLLDELLARLGKA